MLGLQKNSLLLFFTLLATAIIAQEFPSEEMVPANHFDTEWCKEMRAETPNVFKAAEAYNRYFKTRPFEESKWRSVFRRWIEDARLSIDEKGNHLPNPLLPHQFIPSPQAEGGGSGTGSWTALGPNFAEKTKCGTSSDLSGGFCDRVYINPYNTNNLFAGFSYGGLWVSQDQGDTWSLTDAAIPNGTNTYANRDLYYGEIEASAVDNSLVYAATEYALLKSVDSGNNWSICPQLNREASGNTRSYYLALSKLDQNVVLATFGRQVFRSIDGGNTWTVVFDNSNGGNNRTYTSQYANNSTFGIYDRTYNFFGLESTEGDQKYFYLGVWNAQNQAEIWRSTDDGASFQFLLHLGETLERTIPNNLVLSARQQSSDQFLIHSLFTYDSLYQFLANGQVISRTPIDAKVVTFGTEVNSLEAMGINPANADELYVGFYFASSITKSTDGGLTFADQTSGYSGCPKYVHPDVRSIDVQGDLILIGSDGGLAISKDKMATVSSDIGREISAIDIWGFTSSARTDLIAVGCDHGPTKIRRFAGEDGWISIGGGDASDLSINSSNEEWIYFDRAIGNQFKAELDDNNNVQSNVSINNDIDLNQLAFHPYIYFTAYPVDGNNLLKTEDNFGSYSPVSIFNSNIRLVRVAPDNPDYLYVLTDNGVLRQSTDAGINWAAITPPTSVSGGQTNILDFAIGATELELWVAYGNWQNTAKILKSTDGGVNWENITTTNLPLTPVSQIAYQPGTNGGIYLAFAGMSGVWYRNNTMPQWEALGSGLPSVGYIRNIFPVPNKGKLRIGSSRGIWEHDLYETSAPMANFASFSNIWGCNLPLQLIQNSTHAPGAVTYQWSFPGATPDSSTEASPTIEYAQSGQYEVSLTITHENGQSNTQTVSNFIQIIDGPGCLMTNSETIILPSAKVYPNPTTKMISVELPQKESELMVKIVDTNGRIIRREAFENSMKFDLNLEQLPIGIYFLEMEGERKYNQVKIVKDK